MRAEPLLEIRDLECAYGARGRSGKRPLQRAVQGVSCEVNPGETVALVGESGSGKTTIARAVAGLLQPIGGTLMFEGTDIAIPPERRARELRRSIQLVFQNPDLSLNPRSRVGATLARPLDLFFDLSRRERRLRITQLLEDVQLDARYARRYPSQLSGGERQRIAIARALAAQPKLILCDEVVSALDVSVQASILDLLRDLQREHGIAYLFIAHDLAVVRWLAHRVVVLYQGQVMEQGTATEVYSPPFHPYTESLLASVPEPDPERLLMIGGGQPEVDRRIHDSPNADDVTSLPQAEPAGCPYAAACPRHLGPVCDVERPPWRESSATHGVLCHIPLQELQAMQSGAAVELSDYEARKT